MEEAAGQDEESNGILFNDEEAEDDELEAGRLNAPANGKKRNTEEDDRDADDVWASIG